MIRRPVPWPNGAKVAVAITFDMDADSLVHLEHPRDSITRVSTISMLRYGPEWRCRGFWRAIAALA
jgi:hypothetical protein